jgi:hypothetical protein
VANRNRGWILSDAIVAISIILLLAGIVAGDMAMQAKAGQHLENFRVATDEAELALAQMQQGYAPHLVGSDAVRVEPVAGGADVPQGKWVRITIRRGGESAALVGLVKANAIKGG